MVAIRKRLALYKALELRQRANPLFLRRTLRYYVHNRAHRFRNSGKHQRAESTTTSKRRRSKRTAAATTTSSPMVQQVQRELRQVERACVRHRSLVVRLLPRQHKKTRTSVAVLSVFAESNMMYTLVESYEAEESSSPVAIPLEFAFARRKRGENVVLLLQRFANCSFAASSSDGGGQARQTYRTDGPLVITQCATCAQQRQHCRDQDAAAVVLGDVADYRPAPSRPLLASFSFTVSKSDGGGWFMGAGEVEGNGFRFELQWTAHRVGTSECREHIESADASGAQTRPLRPNDRRFQVTRLEEVLPVRVEWQEEHSTTTTVLLLRDYRCPVCSAYLGSWAGMLAHFATDHDQLVMQTKTAAAPPPNSPPCAHSLVMAVAATPTRAVPVALPLPLRYAHTTRGYAMYDDLDDAGGSGSEDDEVDGTWRNERDRRNLGSSSSTLLCAAASESAAAAVGVPLHYPDADRDLMLLWNQHVRRGSKKQQQQQSTKQLVMDFVPLALQQQQQQQPAAVIKQRIGVLLVCLHDYGRLSPEEVDDVVTALLAM